MSDKTPSGHDAQGTQDRKRELSLLAVETYGENFHGQPPADPEGGKPKGGAGAAPEDDDAPQDPDDGLDGEQEAGSAERDREEEDDNSPDEGEGQDGDDDAPSIASLAELAEHLEADPDWVMGLKVQVKVDGKPAEATVSDLVRSYQIGEAADRRLEDAKTKAKALTQELAGKAQELNAQFATAAKLIEQAEAALDGDVKAINWSQLREEDPAEYAAKRADIDERREKIEELKRDAKAAYQKAVDDAKADAVAMLHERRDAENKLLLEAVPEWRDEEKAAPEKERLVKYLLDSGFAGEDIAKTIDHRLIVMARKAMLFDQAQGKKTAARKKLTKVPKVLKPGAPRSDQQRNQDRAAQAKAALKKTGTLGSAMAALKAKRGA